MAAGPYCRPVQWRRNTSITMVSILSSASPARSNSLSSKDRDRKFACHRILTWLQLLFHRHFKSQLDPYMIGALAEIASGRRLFADNYDRKTKETKMGIMQVTPEVAQWLGRELGYKNYDIELEENIDLLYWPFINVYFGAAYVKSLFSCDEKSRRNPKYAGGLSSRHELLTEIDTNLHPVKNSCNNKLCELAPLRELMMMALKDDESISDENDKEKAGNCRNIDVKDQRR